MSAPVMLAGAAPSQDEIVAAIRAAAENTAKVMPPLVAKHLRQDLLAVAATVAEAGDEVGRLLVAHWAERVDEINAYAARAGERVEFQVFADGASPDEASFTAPIDTDHLPEDLVIAGDWGGSGVAHRSTIYLHGSWVIDRPARNEAAA